MDIDFALPTIPHFWTRICICLWVFASTSNLWCDIWQICQPRKHFISCLKRPCPKGVLVKFRRLVLSVCARCVLVTWGRRSDQRQRNCADQQLRPRASRVSTLCLLASLARVGMKDQTNSSPVGKHSLHCFLKIGVGKHLKQLAKIMWNKLRHTRTKQMNFIIVFLLRF